MGWLRSVLGIVVGTGMVLLACADEDPTSIGSNLLPGGAIRTYELILEPDIFLASDTALSGFVVPANVGFRVLAGGFDGLHANTLARYAGLPVAISYTDTAGMTQVDSMPVYLGGRLELRLDTLRSTAPGPVRLELHRLGEDWDPRSATWTQRVDSGQVELAWAVPGGTSAGLVDTATWEPGSGDTIVSFDVDSQTIALWADTADAARGALIRVATPDARLISPSSVLRVDARPSARPDTVVVVTLGVTGSTFVFDPAPPVGSDLRVGGVPTWRSFLRFERLDTLAFPCPQDPGSSNVFRASDCVLRLDEAKVNYAALLVEPAATPSGLVPVDSLFIDARAALTTPSVPLERSPLGARAAAFTSEGVPPVRFQPAGGGPLGPVEVPVTNFIAALVRGQGDADTPPASVLALVAVPEGGAFGFGNFAPLGGASPPRLRLIVSVATQVEIR